MKPKKKPLPLASNIVLSIWQERDRLHINAHMAPEIPHPFLEGHKIETSERTIAEWWDEDAESMFELGLFKPGIVRGRLGCDTADPKMTDSVRKYLVDMGLARCA